jgi:epoxyqueuosine reductase
LGNCGNVAAIEPVAEALARHPSSLVRGHAAWALARLDGAAGPLLERASRDDPDEFVRAEARAGCLDPQQCRA